MISAIVSVLVLGAAVACALLIRHGVRRHRYSLAELADPDRTDIDEASGWPQVRDMLPGESRDWPQADQLRQLTREIGDYDRKGRGR